jgi:phenylacetate-CoA ligase
MNTECYEATRLQHLAYWQKMMADLTPRLRWSRAQIEAEQTPALRKFLRYAIDNSPWHRERLGGLELEDFSAARLSEIPPMSKDDLMENWDRIVTDPRCRRDAAEAHLEEIARTGADAYFMDKYHVVASGGSSGRRGVFVHDWHSWAVCFAGIMRGLASVASRSPTKAAGLIALVAAHVPTHKSSAITRTFSEPSRRIVHAPVTLPIAQIVEVLNRAQPSILISYASMLPILCEETRAGRLQFDPAMVWSNSEVLLPEIRAEAETTWQVPVVNSWVASESHGAFTCHVGPGFHLAEDLNVIELVDEDGIAVAAGARSAKILVTNFHQPPDAADSLRDVRSVPALNRAMRLWVGVPEGRRPARPGRRYIRVSRRAESTSPCFHDGPGPPRRDYDVPGSTDRGWRGSRRARILARRLATDRLEPRTGSRPSWARESRSDGAAGG